MTFNANFHIRDTPASVRDFRREPGPMPLVTLDICDDTNTRISVHFKGKTALAGWLADVAASVAALPDDVPGDYLGCDSSLSPGIATGGAPAAQPASPVAPDAPQVACPAVTAPVLTADHRGAGAPSLLEREPWRRHIGFPEDADLDIVVPS